MILCYGLAFFNMAAIVIDIKDTGLRTPEQALRVFYLSYDPESVRSGLLAALCGFANGRRLANAGELPELKEAAQLFDALLSLVNAVHDLRQQTEGRCVICGRTGESSPVNTPENYPDTNGSTDRAG
ncbi:hypothetical protein LX99_04230 [Mucilaginibacter oryzae]|uniref:Uncharacterized protein n=1 Tax=Mucilaginibacter oryzae TaxID=468058 RepID=A0A316H2L9_9SPHI|nr:hypothetical protein [Mucilaginibacter oryzae]PWK72900.1 hypothetical protein LX99_04230 [Mucilaginibacter oryzae]